MRCVPARTGALRGYPGQGACHQVGRGRSQAGADRFEAREPFLQGVLVRSGEGVSSPAARRRCPALGGGYPGGSPDPGSSYRSCPPVFFRLALGRD